jgi:16S rRNA (guanine527-N7)-methyltransferase
MPLEPFRRTGTSSIIGAMEMSMIPKDLLKEGAAELGVELSEDKIDSLSRFVDMLLEWNQKFNLTRITDPYEIVTKHLLDSLTCLKTAAFPEGASVIDVGTGAGLPGIPLKIVRPDLRMTLLDATRKKLSFIEAVVNELGLKEVVLLHGRAEDVAQDPSTREAFKVVVARAVAEMRVLAEYTIPLALVGGTIVVQKGPEVQDELAAAKKAISQLGGEVERVETLTIPRSDMTRSLVVIRKRAPTPKRYPRRHAEISKGPL